MPSSCACSSRLHACIQAAGGSRAGGSLQGVDHNNHALPVGRVSARVARGSFVTSYCADSASIMATRYHAPLWVCLRA